MTDKVYDKLSNITYKDFEAYIRLDEATKLAEKVLKLLPKGSPIEIDIGTTIENHLFRLRKETERDR